MIGQGYVPMAPGADTTASAMNGIGNMSQVSVIAVNTHLNRTHHHNTGAHAKRIFPHGQS